MKTAAYPQHSLVFLLDCDNIIPPDQTQKLWDHALHYTGRLEILPKDKASLNLATLFIQ